MLAYPQNRIHLPLQGIAEMDMPARRLGQTVEQAAAVGARMAEELQEVSAAGELAAFAGRLSEMERETREELSTLPVRDWDYAWAQASEPRIREALSELPEQVRPVARELAERYVAQASISARREYELEKIRAARQQWQRRVDESVAAGNGEAAEQWLRAGSRVFVPETELEEQAVSVRSRSALRYWRNALEQDAEKALHRLQLEDASLPEAEKDRKVLAEMQVQARRRVQRSLAEEISREVEACRPIPAHLYERAANVGLISQEQVAAAAVPAAPLPPQKSCDWMRRIDESRPEDADELLLALAVEPVLPHERRLLLQRMRAWEDTEPAPRHEMSAQLWNMYRAGRFGCPGDAEPLVSLGRVLEQLPDALRQHASPEARHRWLRARLPQEKSWICLTPQK